MDTKSNFLQLPPELRNRIYREVAKGITAVMIRASGFGTPPLAQVCQQIRCEFLPVLETVHPGITATATGCLVPRSINKVYFNIKDLSPSALSKRLHALSKATQKHDQRLRTVFVEV